MKRDPHPISAKFAEIFASIIVLIIIGGPGIYLLILAANHDWNLWQLLGGLALISSAVTLTAILLRTK